MKYLKLLAIFLVVAVGLFFAFSSDISIFGNRKKPKFPKDDKIDVAQKCTIIERKWKEISEWNDNLYIGCYEEIEQWKGGRLVTEKSYYLLRNTLFECATNKLRDSFSSSLLANNYSDSKVQKMRHGVDTLMKYEEIKIINNQPRLSHILEVYDLYSDVLKFVNSSHAIGAAFDAEKLTWTPFDTRKERVKASARQFKNNPLYAEMNTVPGFKDGLDENKLDAKTETYRSSFYDKLSDKIIAHFEYIVPTNDTATTSKKKSIVVDNSEVMVYVDKLDADKQAQLGKIWNQFDDENNGPGFTRLTNFKTRYGKALNAMNAQ